tara:strand:- start:213 stop:647 length:435 start_codon:yes stop_codon:yes gene_type:complete
MIGLTVLFLGFAWYQHVKPKRETECACEDEPSFFKSKRFLGIITVAALLLVAFPYYSHVFVQDNSQNVVYVSNDDVERVTFDVEGMTCTGCEASVEHAVNNVDGVLESNVSYHNRSATITYDKSKTNRDALVQAINSTGFKIAE